MQEVTQVINVERVIYSVDMLLRMNLMWKIKIKKVARPALHYVKDIYAKEMPYYSSKAYTLH